MISNFLKTYKDITIDGMSLETLITESEGNNFDTYLRWIETLGEDIRGIALVISGIVMRLDICVIDLQPKDIKNPINVSDCGCDASDFMIYAEDGLNFTVDG